MRMACARALGSAAVGAALWVLASAAAAQTYSVSVQGSKPDLGRVVSAPSGDTIFRIDAASGAVTKISGSGVRMTSGPTRAKVTVSCGNTGTCNTRKVSVRLGSFGSPTGRAGQLQNFAIAMGTAQIATPPTGTDPVAFTLKPIGKNSSKTFWIGADVPIEGNTSGGLTGSAASSFYVHAAREGQTPVAGDTGAAVAQVLRPVTLTKHSNLSFGRLVRPPSGQGSVAVLPSGARQLANVVGLATPAPTSASYTVQGERGRSISLDIPESFTMSGPGGGALEVQTTTDAATTPVLSGVAGYGGSYTFKVGGAFQLGAETSSGAYSGVFNVMVTYN
jgi:hypothetical protein